MTADGRVEVSTDSGETWEARGRIGGQSEAILSTPDRLLLAVTDLGIVQSEDGGETFETLIPTAR